MNERDKEIAKQIGISDYEIEDYDLLTIFAELIRADEREACAELFEPAVSETHRAYAATIRNRGNNERTR